MSLTDAGVVLAGMAYLFMAAILAIRFHPRDGYLSPVTAFTIGAFFYLVAIPVEISLTHRPYLYLHTRIPIPTDVLLQIIGLTAVATCAFILGYTALMGRTRVDSFRFTSDESGVAVRTLSVLSICWLAVMIGLFGAQLVATHQYSSAYLERYSSPVFAFGMQSAVLAVGMLAFVLNRFVRSGWRRGLPLAGLLSAWGVYSNQKAPLFIAALAAFGVVQAAARGDVRRARVVVTIVGLPAVLGMASTAFSRHRGGSSVFFGGEAPVGYLTTIEPAGPFASLLVELQSQGASAPGVGFASSLVNALIGWVPRALWPGRPLDLADQFGRTRIPGWTPGQGYGYSPLAEGLLLGGTIGVLILFVFFGALVGLVRAAMTRRSGGVIGHAFYNVYFMSAIFVFFRGPLQGFVTSLVQAASILLPAVLLSEYFRSIRGTSEATKIRSSVP